MALLIKNISSLVQTEEVPKQWVAGKEMAGITTITDAFLIIEDGFISDFGKMNELRADMNPDGIIDATGRFVFPSFCDPHTHLVYSGSREKEYTDKIRGLSYEEIARRGGGILNSSERLHLTSE